MKVWMLTGDKGLTAKQIGYSCGIIGQIDGGEKPAASYGLIEVPDITEPKELKERL